MENDNTSKTKSNKWNVLRWLENAFIATVLLAALGFFWSSYFAFRQNMLVTYEKLADDTESIIFMDELLYTFCQPLKKQHYSSSGCLNCGCFNGIEVFKTKKEMIDQFAKITGDIRTLGKFLSHDTYRRIHELISWNDVFLSATNDACHLGLLVNPSTMDKWRDDIIGSISEEGYREKNLYNSLKNYFLDIFTNRREERYVSYHVNIKDLPIYKKTK